MRNIKIEHNLTGSEHWPIIQMVNVPGNKEAQSIPPDTSAHQGEKVIQNWEQIAVLKVTPSDKAILFGFQSGSHMQLLNSPIETKDGMFGVHVGDGDVNFFVIPADHTGNLQLELIQVTTSDNKNYQDLPLY